LQEKIKKLEADKNFYEEALETRTNQLEEMEQRCE
jgi:predicted enzyme related to lactoylglutathione lyase